MQYIFITFILHYYRLILRIVYQIKCHFFKVNDLGLFFQELWEMTFIINNTKISLLHDMVKWILCHCRISFDLQNNRVILKLQFAGCLVNHDYKYANVHHVFPFLIITMEFITLYYVCPRYLALLFAMALTNHLYSFYLTILLDIVKILDNATFQLKFIYQQLFVMKLAWDWKIGASNLII